MRKLENKVVFITGGNSGIGKAAALEATKEGAIVVVADMEKLAHHQTMDDIAAIQGVIFKNTSFC